MVKTEQKKSKHYQIISEADQKTLLINYDGYAIVPSIEDKPFCMSQVTNLLLEVGHVTQVVFRQREDFIYAGTQAEALTEVADFIKELMEHENIFNNISLGSCSVCLPARRNFMEIFVMSELREDPIGAYIHLSKKFQEEKSSKKICPNCKRSNDPYVKLLEKIFNKMSKLLIIKQVIPYLKEYDPSNRDIYKHVFSPEIKPSFLFARVAKTLPIGAKELDAYSVDNTRVVILKKKEDIRTIYHMIPPEYNLLEEYYLILGKAKEILARHKPTKAEFVDPEHTREVFRKVGRDLISDLLRSKGIQIDYDLVDELSDILVRYTIGFGIIELILKDPKVQDISINSPASMTPITIIHADYGECVTNITITPSDVDSWATKLRLMSGRPLDESNPVLDAELLVPGSRSRVAVIQQPLSPSGLAFSFRRHRDKPWTLPLFVKNKMLTPLAAGLMDFIIQGGRTLLVAGTRSAGKTSLLASLMIQIPRTVRIITVEDTLEIPVYEFKKLNYDIQSLKVQSVITKGEQEITAAEGIRTSLRMGDSSLIVGEVRSEEAIALYEAMRVGALANVVAGTIHGDSPYGVFDRVVNDLKVPATSFKATDLIIVCNPVKSASGLKQQRRVIQVTEIRKNWDTDPLKEHAFVDLLVYNPKTDQLEPTDTLLQGESEILKSIGSRVREWAGDFDAIWQNVEVRAKIIQTIFETAEKENKPMILEADFMVQSNDMLHTIMDQIKQSSGKTDTKLIFSEWLAWFKHKISKID
jgi:archaeal flagellar protein FlaI